MTRNNDKYLLLNQRVSFAEKVNADIFISIHSDSSKIKKQKELLYSLYRQNLDLEAKKSALRENKSDLIGGLGLK